ncbi:MAG: hypothetical protein HRT53_19235 [Colwellia sp.]|nr:hypothetical protein [Colwellia sp.]
MFWVLLFIGIILSRFGISSLFTYNRVKSENKRNGVFLKGLEYPNAILKVNNLFFRVIRKFFWQASTDGTWQHGVFSVVMFYLGISIMFLGAFIDPESANILFG